ncbi:MAG: hypothetical protein U5J63_17845 [Fodinibius sp.]|nr:hypothetical protein [Fodinibius sp.]
MAGIIAAGVLLPLVYLLIRAFGASPEMLNNVVFRMRNLRLLGNTLLLTFGVLILDALIALPLAYLSVRVKVKARRFITLLGVLPLAIPGYVMAYALLGMGGYNGTFQAWFGLNMPRISGFTGSLIVLSIALSLISYLKSCGPPCWGLDQSIEEVSRSLGYDAQSTFLKVILPQLRPAFLAGSLLISLHVIGDFGTVSLMRFETFSYALYLQYIAAYDRIYAAWLALMLLALTTGALVLEYKLLKKAIFHRLGRGVSKAKTYLDLGPWAIPAYTFVAVLTLVALVLPVSSIVFWVNQTAFASVAGDLSRHSSTR